MSVRAKLSLPQRIVVVVALGLAARVLDWWLLEEHGAQSGWFNYAPNSGLAYGPPERFSPLVVAVGSLILVTAWCTASIWVLHSRPTNHAERNPA
jgi:hypothetical protein